jgi:aryl-alcohol dehydrogenase
LMQIPCRMVERVDSPQSVRDWLEIRAAVARNGARPLQIERLELEGPRDDEVLVRIVAVGVCHTDIGIYQRWNPADQPAVLGHEGAGIVEKAGKNIAGLRVGDHVVLSFASCGQCAQCGSGRPWLCQSFMGLNFGFHRLDGSNALHRSGVSGHFFGQSSFATYSIATEQNAVKVPRDVELALLGPLGCGLQTGAGTVMNTLDVRRGASIAILGTGAVGLAAVMAARIVGANPIIGVDKNPMRLELALELGATHIVDGRAADVAQAVSRIAGGGIDYAVETTGNDILGKLALDLLNLGGAAGFLTPGPRPSLDGGRKAISVTEGSSAPRVFIPRLIDLYRQGQFPFDRLIKFYGFSDINAAIADSIRGDTIKPVLRMTEP